MADAIPPVSNLFLQSADLTKFGYLPWDATTELHIFAGTGKGAGSHKGVPFTFSASDPAATVVVAADFAFVPFVVGGTTTVPAGTFQIGANVDQAQTIVGAGMRQTMLDGQGGVGGGHRLVFGKGSLHVMAQGSTLIKGIGFLNGGGADGVSDGEAGIYVGDGATGTVTLLGCAFDGCENGVFAQPGCLADLVIDRCVFGKNTHNGLADGRSHDNYVACRSLTIKNSVYVGDSFGNTIKCRSSFLDVSGSFVARTTGRWIDLPGGTTATSTGNVYVTHPGADSQNAFGFYDESDAGSVPGKFGSFLSTDDTFYFSRFQENIWVNNPATVVQFVRAKVFWIGQQGATPPTVVIQGPGTLTGENPFVFNETNRVDFQPGIPSDPL